MSLLLGHSMALTKSELDGELLRRRVNLLDLSKVVGRPHSAYLHDLDQLPSPWFADLRYTWNHPIAGLYPPVDEAVLSSQRCVSTSRPTF